MLCGAVSTHCRRLLCPLDGHVGRGLLELAEAVAVQPRPRLLIVVVSGRVAGCPALAGGVDEDLGTVRNVTNPSMTPYLS